MKTTVDLESQSFDVEDAGDVIGLAKTLVNGEHAGILSTVDMEGKPQTRWMSAFSFDEFPRFYSLTAPESRKVEEIRHNPAVNWMFFNKDCSLILNLHGKARIVEDAPVLKRIWQQVVDMSHVYFLDQYASGLGFVVIETMVESVMATSPKNSLRFELDPQELVHLK
ncbi:pyridoxamine 5'-phosphate oxidase family protein [Phragmitibacter flavus]|uniref:Pyridoxamine 5'-phosphate oxidase family protein n=1 Tax=Phragmitibacter flavus TaxID=2576071 RepID=A0A5R8KAL3_9BACT|nr:pyridoxamine 5'-phosphate oxidase family protein [Phragmitibacter flavus]TLD69307.1 pyridoxamine 5'-phosphate oxidase family protein [Phragmitibacter flavus]